MAKHGCYIYIYECSDFYCNNREPSFVALILIIVVGGNEVGRSAELLVEDMTFTSRASSFPAELQERRRHPCRFKRNQIFGPVRIQSSSRRTISIKCRYESYINLVRRISCEYIIQSFLNNILQAEVTDLSPSPLNQPLDPTMYDLHVSKCMRLRTGNICDRRSSLL